MSMLAERREKKKWSVDPRGMNWSRDENKFGMKMLQKMGWSKGKGLGANEDGNTEHIKIKHKSDNRGVGCSIKYEKNWIAHQDDFASLLADLNNHHTEENSGSGSEKEVASLEKNSKTQKRVHYQKFARGKDLSNYKTTDLDAIFGKSKSQSAPVTPLNLSEDEASDKEGDGTSNEEKDTQKDKSNHVIAQISVQEYFAQRMALMKKSLSAPSSPVPRGCESANQVRGDANEDEPLPRKKTKSKKKKMETDDPSQEEKGKDTKKKKLKKKKNECENVKNDLDLKKKKKLKKRKQLNSTESQDDDQLLLKKSRKDKS